MNGDWACNEHAGMYHEIGASYDVTSLTPVAVWLTPRNLVQAPRGAVCFMFVVSVP